MENNRNVERAVTVITGTLLFYFGVKKRTMLGGALAVAGAGMVRSGAMGPSGSGELNYNRVITIDKPLPEVFRYWRDLENLPHFMKGLKSVKVVSPTRSRWVMNIPGSRVLEWDAELLCHSENESLSWRSLPGARVPNSGSVNFEPASGNRGTVVRVSISYKAPMGMLGGWVAKLFGYDPSAQLAEDLRRLKSILEAGQIPRSSEPAHALASVAKEKNLQDASEHSFPASDAPSYT